MPYPNVNRAWIICLMPVRAPNVLKYAGNTVHKRPKNRIRREQSRRLRLMYKVPTMPVMILQFYQ